MTRYIKLRGKEIWHTEWKKKGESLVILHGGLSATEDCDIYLLPAFKGTHHVFAYDRTGQGRTADRVGSLHFDFQTTEAIAYLEDVVKKPAHLVGWSDGGIIALMVAMQRPDLVKSIVAIGANYHYEHGGGEIPNWEISDEDRGEYSRRSPDAAHTLDEKTDRMRAIWNSEPTLMLSDLAKVTCPTLILAGDDELFSLSHTTSMYEALPHGRLAIVPGTSHFVLKEKPELTQAIIRDFLANLEPPITRAPVRRADIQII